MRKTFTTAAFAVVVALALAACGDKATDDTTTGKTGGNDAPAAPALAGGTWMGDAPDMAKGVTAISFFKPG
jgi:hypothetical protein